MNIFTLFQPGWKVVGVATLIGAAAGAWCAYHFTSLSLNADIATLKEQHAKDQKAISDAAAKSRDDNAATEHAAANQIARADQKHTQELNDALTENQALRDAVSTGTRKLQLAKASLATCNLSASTATSAPGVVNASTVEFSPEFGRHIYDIRSGAISDREKVIALQDYIRAAQSAGVIAK